MKTPMLAMDLRGDVELVRAMTALPIKFENRVISKALTKAMGIYRKAARVAAPVATGRLKKSIKTKSIKRRGRNRNQIAKRVSTGTRADLGIPKDAKGYYPTAIEYGWTDRHGHQHAPRSYMRSAWNGSKSKISAKVVREFRAGLEKVAKSVAAA